MKKILITTPIYYPNDQLHIGHAYTTTLADYLARYKKEQGYKVMFLTGSDEHGQKIDDTAKKHNVTTIEYVNKIVDSFKNLWEKLGISYDLFIRTTDTKHKDFVQKTFSELLAKGFIYKGEYTDYYCKPCESYYTKTQLKDNRCPTCGREVTLLSEETYFLKVTQFKDFVTFKLKNTDLLTPSHRVNELVNNFLENDFTDLSVTRTSFDWGIKTNEDPKHVIYVWLDALFNYVSALTYNESLFSVDEIWGKDSNSEIVQFVGKEITRFHCIYWPIMLEMKDYKLPRVIAHGWLLSGDTKMSKSLGNVINPLDIIEKYGKDALRFYLINNIQTGEDGKFTEELFLETYNGILVNKYSNLVNRTFTMLEKYNNSIIPSKEFTLSSILSLKNSIVNLETEYHRNMKEFKFSDSTKNLISIMEELNKFIDLEQPWTKTPELQIEIVSALMYGLIDLNILLKNILIDSTDKFFEAIGIKKEQALLTKAEGKKVQKLDFLFTRLK